MIKGSVRQHPLLGSVLILALCAYPASAEVMDKMPTVYAIWQWSLMGAVAGFIACRVFPVLGILTFAFSSLFLFSLHREAVEPYVGPAILHEAGPGYALHIVAAWCIVVMGHILGTVFFFRQFKRLAK